MNYNNTALETIFTDCLDRAINQTLETFSITMDENKYNRIRKKTEDKLSMQKEENIILLFIYICS